MIIKRNKAVKYRAYPTQTQANLIGYNYLLTYCQAFNTTITPLKTTQPKGPQEELLQDFMSLLASFSGKYYRLRGWKQQLNLLHDAENTIHEKQDAQDEEGDPA